jgi:hypothetical protein
MEMSEKWAIIKQCIQDANERQVDQSKMAEFLKNQFDLILATLEGLVQEGIDLSDRTVVSNLKELELALHQIPQHRVFAFDALTVIEEFEEYVERFYHILSLPKQDAETSFTCSWIVKRLDFLADTITNEDEDEEIEKELDTKQLYKLTTYLGICKTLCENGSAMIKAYVVGSAEHLAHALTLVDLPREAEHYWQFVIYLLSQDNLRITQREGRLMVAKDIINHLD